jgi:polyisoprenoid-binding protein YceI
MSATTSQTRTFSIDPAHSEAAFQVRHLVTRVRGRFTEFEGTVTTDASDPSRSSVQVTIKASSIDTSQPDRDAHLRSADFFEVEKFPTLTFRSASVRRSSDDRFDVTGELTIHGVARTVTVPVAYLGLAKDPWGKERAGFEAEFTINRKDYGLTWNAALETGGFLVGDEVKITLAVQAVAQ